MLITNSSYLLNIFIRAFHVDKQKHFLKVYGFSLSHFGVYKCRLKSPTVILKNMDSVLN